MNGSIDDARIYDRALSASEIQQLYTLGAGTHVNTSSANLQDGSSLSQGLVGLWTFDGSDISGSTIYDLSGNGNDGANNGAVPTIGKLGQALSFDGSSSYVSVAGGNLPSGLNAPFTVAAWVKTTSLGQFGFIAGWGTNLNYPALALLASNACLNVWDISTVCVPIPSSDASHWVFLVATFDGTYGDIYMNGV